MNAASRAISYSSLFSGNLFQAIFQKQVLTMSLVVLLCLFSAIGVVYVRDSNRRMFTQLQLLQKNRDKLYVEWGQLLLEESTWATQARVQRIAMRKLNMQVPPPASIIMVRA